MGDQENPRVMAMTWQPQSQETRSPVSLSTGITYEDTSCSCKVRLVLVALVLDVAGLYLCWAVSLLPNTSGCPA